MNITEIERLRGRTFVISPYQEKRTRKGSRYSILVSQVKMLDPLSTVFYLQVCLYIQVGGFLVSWTKLWGEYRLTLIKIRHQVPPAREAFGQHESEGIPVPSFAALSTSSKMRLGCR